MVNETRPIKRRRRSRAKIEQIKAAMFELLEAEHPMTVRQLFYRLVSQQTIEKTEAEYKSTVCRLTADMRRSGEIPYTWLADNTRWMRKPASYQSLTDFMERQQELYRRDLWAEQNAYVEIWLEKEALAGVLMESTRKWDVPLMVCRGYPSLSFLHSAAETIRATEKPTHLYYFGDCDPSGRDIPRTVEQSICEMADRDIHFEIVAVTDEQIRDFNLITRPTKRSDSRSKGFEGESVEVDAIPPRALVQMCDHRIVQHLDIQQVGATENVEDMERETLRMMAEMVGGAE